MISALQGPVVLTAMVFLVVAYILNIHWRASLFYNGLQFIKDFQRVLLPYPIAIGFQNICSLLCASSFKAVVLAVVALVSRRKLAVIVFITFFIINVYLNSLSKLLFSDPRPFWFSTDILQLEWKCPGQFGNPSGHSRSAALFYYLIINDFIAKYGRPGCGWWAVIVCVWVLVPLSRLALGAHSSNQVLFGMLLGLAWLVFYRFGLQQMIYRCYNCLIRRKENWQLGAILAVYFAVAIVPVFAYQLQLHHLTPQRFVDNMLVGCPHTKANTALKVLNGTFTTCGIAGFVFGLLIGVLLVNRRATNYHLYLLGRWRHAGNSWLTVLFRIAVELLPAMLVACFFGVLLPRFFVNVYLKYLLVHFSSFSFGLLVVLVPSWFLADCGLIELEPLPNQPPRDK